MRRRHAVDKSQAAIVTALRAVGAKVHVMSHVGGGVPDLLVTYQGMVHLLECKNVGPASAKKLTKAELKFATEHPVAVVTTPVEALIAIGHTIINHLRG